MFKDYFPAHLVTLNTIKLSKREEQRISIMLTRFPQREVQVTAFHFGATVENSKVVISTFTDFSV